MSDESSYNTAACKYVSCHGIVTALKGNKHILINIPDADDLNSFVIPNHKFILLTSYCDCSIPEDYPDKAKEILDSEYLIHWFSQNVTDHSHPKLSPIPIGFNFHSLWLRDGFCNGVPANAWWNGDIVETPIYQENKLMSIKKQPFYEREVMVYCNFLMQMHTRYGSKDRQDAITQMQRNLLVCEYNKVLRMETWTNMTKYAFCASPHGNGMDCHRTWEALALGSIPIVKKSTIDVLYEGLPVLIVNEWSDVTEDLLKSTIETYKNTEFNMEKITLKYWVDKIKSKWNEQVD